MLDQSRQTVGASIESVVPNVDTQERIAGGLCYIDSAGVNLQVLYCSITIAFSIATHLNVLDLQPLDISSS